MSRGFVKEDDQEEIPIVAPRADLPAGIENFVTKTGYAELLEEKKMMLREQDYLEKSNEKDYRISFNHLNAKLQLLNERITSAKIIDPRKLPQDEIHFGALVTFRNSSNKINQEFQIVGVDEANISKGKISFTTPLAKALQQKKVGETAEINIGDKKNIFEVLKIKY